MGIIPHLKFEFEGSEPPYGIVEVSQIFCNSAEIEMVPSSGALKLNGEPISGEDSLENKRELYLKLCGITGYSSPWGCLTGVRPAKLVNKMLGDGLSLQEAKQVFSDCYLVAPEKIDLLFETALVQAPFFEKNEGQTVVDWYANMPFCPTRCLYCSFTSNPVGKYKKKIPAYLDAMEEELKASAEIYENLSARSETLYLGGGTPTSLDEIQFDRYINMFGKYIDIGALREFSLEAGRPDSITRHKLESAKSAGVTRISINPQTMNDITLKRIGRAHGAAQVEEAFELARECGFDNINMDVIAGLPGENIEMFAYTMEKIRQMNPESMTVHTLSIKRAANLKHDTENIESLSPEIVGKMVAMGRLFAGKMSMHPFYMYRQKHMLGNHENVSYCRPGFESPYNIHIMEEDRTIIGIGAGAVTKVVFPDNRIERAFNVKDVEYYLERLPEMIERKRKLLG